MARAAAVNSTFTGAVAAGGITAPAASHTMTDLTGIDWPSGAGVFAIQVGDDLEVDAEIVQVTRSAGLLTGSFVLDHDAGDPIYYLADANDLNNKPSLDATNTFTPQQLFGDGSASAPAIANDGDTNTGLIFDAADQIGLVTGGTKRVTLSTSLLSSTVPIRGAGGSSGSSVDVQVRGGGDGLYRPSSTSLQVVSQNTAKLVFGTASSNFTSVPLIATAGFSEGVKHLLSADFTAGEYYMTFGEKGTFQFEEAAATRTFYLLALGTGGGTPYPEGVCHKFKDIAGDATTYPKSIVALVGDYEQDGATPYDNKIDGNSSVTIDTDRGWVELQCTGWVNGQAHWSVIAGQGYTLVP